MPFTIFPERLWKTRETFVTVPGFRVDFWNWDLQNKNQECYSLDGNPRALFLMADHSKFHSPSFQVPHTFLKILFPNSSNFWKQVQRIGVRGRLRAGPSGFRFPDETRDIRHLYNVRPVSGVHPTQHSICAGVKTADPPSWFRGVNGDRLFSLTFKVEISLKRHYSKNRHGPQSKPQGVEYAPQGVNCADLL
jgi:hypothetical protein